MRCAAISCVVLFAMGFEPPGPDVRRAAVGDLTELSPVLRRAFSADAAEFQPIPKPGPHDWFAVHPEPGQTLDEFKATVIKRQSSQGSIDYWQLEFLWCFGC
jgi:hypothetical protein